MTQSDKDSDFDDHNKDLDNATNQAEPIEQVEATEQLAEQSKVSEANQTDSLDYPAWVQTFQKWLGDGHEQEVKNVMDFFDRSSARWQAVKELTADEFAQKSQYLKRDLMMFYHQYQTEMAESEFVQAIKESAWHELAEMTDKAQIEWHELEQDFRHQGVYEQNEWVGMGVIVCKQCHYKMTFVHPERLSACPECGHGSFLREALAP